MFICCSLGAEWLAGTMTHSCVTGSPAFGHTRAPCVSSQPHRHTQLGRAHPENAAPLDSENVPKLYTHS